MTTAQAGDTITLTPQPSGVTSAFRRCQIVIEGFAFSADTVWMQVASDDCAAWTFTVPDSKPGHYEVRGWLFTSDTGVGNPGVVASPLQDLEIVAGGTPVPFTSNYPVQSWSPDEIASDATPAYGSPMEIIPPAGLDGCRLGFLGGFEQAWTQQDVGCEAWRFVLPAPTPSAVETFFGQNSDVRYYGWVGTSAWSEENPELPFLGARWAATYSNQVGFWTGDAGGGYESNLPAIFAGSARDQAFYAGDPTDHTFAPVLFRASGMDCLYDYPYDPNAVVPVVGDDSCDPYDVPGLESGAPYTTWRTILGLRDSGGHVVAEANSDIAFIPPMTPVAVEVPPEVVPDEDFSIGASNDAGIPATYSILVEPAPGGLAIVGADGQVRSGTTSGPIVIAGSFAPSPASTGDAVSVPGPKLGWGTYNVTATFTDVLGTSTSGTGTITVSGTDTVTPTVTAPTKAIRTGPLAGGRALVRVSWTGQDATSGIARYELAQSTDGHAWTTIATTLTAARADRSLASGHSYRFRVRAIDHAGNIGAWVAGATFSLKRYGESSSSVHYKGVWRTSTSAVFWGGKAKVSSKAGAKATFTFTGRSVALVSRLGPSRGNAAIYVNGTKVATIDLHAATTQGPQVVWSRSWSSSGKRVVTVRVSGTNGHPSVVVDGFITAS